MERDIISNILNRISNYEKERDKNFNKIGGGENEDEIEKQQQIATNSIISSNHNLLNDN